MLYLGFVGMSVPFSLLCAALLAGRLEAGWMAPVRTWMLIPWTFLTVGIVLGGWWSYAVLGWGGAWAWDPVENASFHPWLTGTAFLHSAMVLQRRGRMRDWTLILGMSTFLLTLLGTFMTRSGVFNSVHSFTQSEIGPVFLVFIGIVLVYSLVLLSFRSHLLDEEARRADLALGGRSSAQQSSVWSREFAILVQNALFTAFAFTVLLGTLYPLLAEALQSRRVSVGEPYFDRYALPLGLGLVFMMGVGPALPWGRMAPDAALRRFVAPLVAGVVFASVFAVAGFAKPLTVTTLAVVGFAFWSNLQELLEPTRTRVQERGESFFVALARVATRTRRRLGGHIAHYGVLLAVFSLALSKGYREQTDFTMHTGEATPFGPFVVTYAGSERVVEPHRDSVRAKLDVTRDGEPIGTFSPRLNYYTTKMREPIFTPEVYSRPTGDLYFTIIELRPDGDSAVIRMIHQPYQMWLWWSGPLIALGAVLAAWPQSNRARRAAADAQAAAGGVRA
jgi:cytochrome c-type biogenesis protein CcmF